MAHHNTHNTHNTRKRCTASLLSIEASHRPLRTFDPLSVSRHRVAHIRGCRGSCICRCAWKELAVPAERGGVGGRGCPTVGRRTPFLPRQFLLSPKTTSKPSGPDGSQGGSHYWVGYLYNGLTRLDPMTRPFRKTLKTNLYSVGNI